MMRLRYAARGRGRKFPRKKIDKFKIFDKCAIFFAFYSMYNVQNRYMYVLMEVHK